MEDIIQIAQLVLCENHPLPEAQKELILALSCVAIIPTAIIYFIKNIIENYRNSA